MQKIVESPLGLRLLARALLVYALTAFLLLVLASFFLARSNVGSHVLGYVSSGISFLSAFLSSRLLLRAQKTGSLAPAMLFAVLLVILLLTIGFLAGDRKMDPSGVLSVVSFTFAGVSLAGVLPLRISPRRRRGFS